MKILLIVSAVVLYCFICWVIGYLIEDGREKYDLIDVLYGETGVNWLCVACAPLFLPIFLVLFLIGLVIAKTANLVKRIFNL